MSRRVGFCAYRIEIRKKKAREPWRFQRNGDTDGYGELADYLDARHLHLVGLDEPDPETGLKPKNRAMKLVRLTKDEDRRMLAGVFMKGEAGLVQEIHDFTGNADEPTYTTKKTEAPLTPLYFRFHVQDGQRYGIALLETFGKDGLKGYLQKDLAKFFAGRVNPLTVRLTQLVNAEVLKAFANDGKLQDVVLINSGKTKSSRRAMTNANVGDDSLGKDGDKLELRVHKKGGFSQRTIQKLIERIFKKDKGSPTGLIESPLNDDYDDLLVRIEQAGSIHTFSLLNPDESPIREDVTNKIAIGKSGYPTFESLHKVANESWERTKQLIT